jgi:DNA-binding transcriptional LysR family regulator
MQIFDWDDIRYFLEVVRCGSATQVAGKLGVNQSTASRRLSQLEDQLGARLFERSTSLGWVLNAAGERMLEAAQDMAERADSIQRQVLKNSTEVTGLIRLTIGDSSLVNTITPAAQRFCEAHPGVELEFIVSNESLDLAAREADLAIRLTDEPPQNLVGKRIAKIKYQVYGTKDMLEAFEAGDRNMPCITWIGDRRTKAPWVQKSFPTSRIYRVNSPVLALTMARSGMGLLQISCMMGDPAAELHRIPCYAEEGWSLWALSHVDLRTTARVRLLRDVLVDTLEDQRDLLEGKLAGMETISTEVA